MADAVLNLGSYDIDLTDKLGQGTFGVVYRGRHVKKNQEVAVKQCEIKSDQYGFMAMKEIKNFQQLEGHPNIVHLLDFHYSKNAFWMVMEFCDAGDLVKYMKTTELNLANKINIMYQCASAIAFMHTRTTPVVHRDIKPANIMMKTENGTAVVKVTDFGLSKVVEDAPDPGMTMFFTTAAGTPGFMAPEFFMSEPYTSSVDVFAMGLVFLAMLTFKNGDKELVPVSARNRKMKMILPVGMEMAQSLMNDLPTPVLMEAETDDTDVMNSLKRLIHDMAAPARKDRIKMTQAETVLKSIGGCQVGSAVPVVKKKSTDTKMNAELEKEQDKVQASKPLTDSQLKKATTTSSSEGDVGFQILKEALENAIKDKMTTEDKLAAAKEIKEIPFTSLLKHVLGDDTAEDLEFKVGDKVCVDPDEERVRELQKGHGEWNDGMRDFCGREGVVVERVLHVAKVQFDEEQVWSYNPDVLRTPGACQVMPKSPPPKQDMMASTKLIKAYAFNRYDVVKIPEDEEVVKCLQVNHGGWNPKMKHCLGSKGIVNRMDKDGDVFVECINGDDWTFNAEMLTHVDMSKEMVEAGDFVIVNDDKDLVKRLQEDHGGWVEAMTTGLGKSGIVQSIGDRKAKVETRGRSFIWNVAALILVAKGEEMLRAVLKKKSTS